MSLEFSRVEIAVALVSLPGAKEHLRVPAADTAHDGDIQAKLDAAQEAILAKLGPAGDETWTEATVPRAVKHSILLLLDAFYERRGGDEGAEELRKALATIDLLLSLYRDPGLA